MSVTIPEAVLAQHMGVVGKTGSGKTSTAKLCVEQVARGDARVCILDPIKSDWWGLTSSADGKRAGLPFDILGGPRGHVPLHAAAGKAIGELVGSGALPLSIIDMADFGPGEHARFFIDFAQSLFKNARGIVHLVVEEAHMFAPKERSGVGQENLSVHWMKRIATGARSKGIRLMVCTQRLQELHNAVLGSCESVIVHRLTLPADQEPLLKWLKGNTDKATTETIASSLSSLKTGEGWICSGELKLLERRQFPRIKTFDNSATPTGDGAALEVKTAPVDQDKLRSLIGDAVKEAEANDPKKLKERIAELERELTTNGPAITGAAETIERLQGNAEELGKALEQSTAEVGRLKAIATAQWDSIKDCSRWIEAQKGRIHAAHGLLTHAENEPLPLAVNPADVEEFAPPDPGPAIGSVSAAIDRIPSSVRREPATLRIAQPSRPRPAQAEGGIPGPHQKILNSLAWWESVGVAAPTAAQVAFVAGYSPGTGTMNTYFGAMVSAGLIVRDRGIVQLTPDGHKHAQRPQRRPTLQALHEQLRGVLDGPCGKVLDAVIARHGRPAPADEIAKDAGYSPGTGTMNTYFGRMTSLGLITRNRGVVAPTEVVFPPALVRRTA
jgi:hypothetical protein